jgi:hypothetical protein
LELYLQYFWTLFVNDAIPKLTLNVEAFVHQQNVLFLEVSGISFRLD